MGPNHQSKPGFANFDQAVPPSARGISWQNPPTISFDTLSDTRQSPDREEIYRRDEATSSTGSWPIINRDR